MIQISPNTAVSFWLRSFGVSRIQPYWLEKLLPQLPQVQPSVWTIQYDCANRLWSPSVGTILPVNSYFLDIPELTQQDLFRVQELNFKLNKLPLEYRELIHTLVNKYYL